MGMSSVFTRYVGLRRLFIHHRCSGANAYRHLENTSNFSSGNNALYREHISSATLAFSLYDDEAPSSGYPVLIMHGLMGSSTNWNSISKAINSNTKRKVIAVDARNHGDSPHSPDMSYDHMAEDLRKFINEYSLGRVSVIGHSMGGKVVMLLALKHPEHVEKLIVVDVAPRRTSPSFIPIKKYLQAMQKIKFEDNMSVSAAHKYVEKELASIVTSRPVRQFLAMNVTKGKNDKVVWKVNLDTLVDTFDEIASFPATQQTFEGPTYFICGGNSDYVSPEDEPDIKKLFPSATIEFIPGAGHWVHADKPNEFVNKVSNFLSK